MVMDIAGYWGCSTSATAAWGEGGGCWTSASAAQDGAQLLLLPLHTTLYKCCPGYRAQRLRHRQLHWCHYVGCSTSASAPGAVIAPVLLLHKTVHQYRLIAEACRGSRGGWGDPATLLTREGHRGK